MIGAMLFEEDHPDSTNDGSSKQRCLFAKGIRTLLESKSADRFGGPMEVKACEQLLDELGKKFLYSFA